MLLDIVTSDNTPAEHISLARLQPSQAGQMAAVASFEAGVHSNAGTALSALSEAEAAFSGVDDVPEVDGSQAQSYGGNSPVCPGQHMSESTLSKLWH